MENGQLKPKQMSMTASKKLECKTITSLVLGYTEIHFNPDFEELFKTNCVPPIELHLSGEFTVEIRVKRPGLRDNSPTPKN